MSKDDFDIIRGSGNVFRDLGHPDADREQLRTLLAARIIAVLDERKLTVRAAHEATGGFNRPSQQLMGALRWRFSYGALIV